MNTLDATTLPTIHSALKQALRAVPGVPADEFWSAENRLFKAPPSDKDALWLREMFVPQNSGTASLQSANRTYRMLGSWIVDFFVAINGGVAAIDAIVSALVAATVTSSTVSYAGQLVEFRGAFVNSPPPANGWFQRSVTVTWRADVITP